MAKKAKKASKTPRRPLHRTPAKAPKRSLQRQTAVLVSADNGNTHVFDTNSLYLLEESILGRQASIDAADVKAAVAVARILANIKPSPSWITTLSTTLLYRIVEGDVDPLESKYTFGAGGRVNIGMAQLVAQLPDLKATAGVYASLDKTTAIVEYTSSGLPLTARSIGHELRAAHDTQVRFADFDAAVTSLSMQMSSVNLISVVAETPFAACWKYQKIPKLSQIIGHWLITGFREMSLEIDGLSFRSTKNPTGTNAFIVSPGKWTAAAIQIP